MYEKESNVIENSSVTELLDTLFNGIYSVAEFEELQESHLLMDEWSKIDCLSKYVGGMEEWAKDEIKAEDISCDWYHGTWQDMRLLNMVAVPRWYSFYIDALSKVLHKKPNANILISACADYGMLCTVNDAIKSTQANPSIIIYDICKTPLKSSQWYADRHNIPITCISDNIITADIEKSAFDLIVTDEFLSVLKSPYKPLIIEKWKQILKKDGTIVTTAMLGEPTTRERRDNYATRAKKLYNKYNNILFPMHSDSEREKLFNKIDKFSLYHTRHMIKDEEEIKNLFRSFKDFSSIPISTPGECVNPTKSFQIVARMND